MFTLVRIIIELGALAGWSLLVILTSNAAAEFAKPKLGKYYQPVTIAGAFFSLVAGIGLIIFIWERVFGFPEVDLHAAGLVSALANLLAGFNHLVLNIVLPKSLALFGAAVFGFVIALGAFGIMRDTKFMKEKFGGDPVKEFSAMSKIAVAIGIVLFIYTFF